MKSIVLAAGALMLACFISSAQAAPPRATIATENSWFVPQLTTGDPSECAPLLAGARAYFARDSDYYPNPLGPTVPGLSATSYDVEDQGTKLAAIKTYTLKMETVIGCGSGCDTGTITVLAKGKAVFTTPPGNPWAEYSDGKIRDYLVGIVDSQVEAYRIPDSGKSALACRMALEPDFKKVTDTDVLAALKAVDSLNQASLGMSRAGGFCGTLGTAGRWQTGIEQALHQALYRPWALQPIQRNPPSDNSYGDYDRIVPQLKLWSLGGFSEHAAFQLYKDRIVATEKVLAGFYIKRFGWPAAKAQTTAHDALTTAISSGFGFYMYKPVESDEEEHLRAALFDHAPMAQIRAIPLDVKTLDPVFSSAWTHPAKDSILNVAIAYPEALQYLLDKGFDPNRANTFGKTPLMYAAQYNQIEAVRILLKAGADPNARTTRPPFDCGYVLSTTNMTPLHYAVRNAGAPLIRTLLQSGAASFIKALNSDEKERDGAPAKWLRLYTNGVPGKEQNPNLSPPEAAALERELAPPDSAELARIASTKVLSAEKESAAGHDEAAYRAISVALQVDSGNQKALADLSLLAFKTGRVGEAAAAATRAAAILKSDSGKASAWFNLGLICQKQVELPTFDGETYCVYDGIEPFLRAWQIAPTKSRAVKLMQVMEKDAIREKSNAMPSEGKFCVVKGRTYSVMIGKNSNGQNVERVYVLHPASETVDPKSIGWTVHWSGRPETFVSPALAGRNVLGDQALTVLESPNWDSSLMVDGQACGKF